MYGGSERVVSYLTEELVEQGHEVTLFATGDSRTSATLVPVWDRAIRLDPHPPEPSVLQVLLLEELIKRAHEFDVVHFHMEHVCLPFARRLGTPSLVTLHGRLDVPGLAALYDEFRDVPVVSISHAQRRPLAAARWAATVYHGLPLGLHRPGNGSGKYLAFLGRITPDKGVDRAIEIARRAGVELRIAAKVDVVDREYFEKVIAPLIDGTFVRYVGEIDERRKTEFLGNALALLFPIAWPEPFGLVMIEAMACGAPVIAFRRGSVPEVVDDGVTGLIVGSVEEAVACVSHARALNRRLCRERFERRFSASRMACEYSRIYAALKDRRSERPADAGAVRRHNWSCA
jgi:glycosyltransferase involved in cell wall biosynthesis